MEYILNILDGYGGAVSDCYSVDIESECLYGWDWLEFYGDLAND